MCGGDKDFPIAPTLVPQFQKKLKFGKKGLRFQYKSENQKYQEIIQAKKWKDWNLDLEPWKVQVEKNLRKPYDTGKFVTGTSLEYYEACYWRIKVPSGLYHDALIYVSFTILDPHSNVHIYKSKYILEDYLENDVELISHVGNNETNPLNSTKPTLGTIY